MSFTEFNEMLKEENRIRAMFYDYAFQFKLLNYLSSTSWDDYVKKTDIIESIEGTKKAGYDCDVFVRFEHRGWDVLVSPIIDCSRPIPESLYREQSKDQYICKYSDGDGHFFYKEGFKYSSCNDYYLVRYEWIRINGFAIDIVLSLGEGFMGKINAIKSRDIPNGYEPVVLVKDIDIDSIPMKVVKQMFAGEGIRLIVLGDIPPIEIPDDWKE